MKIYVFWVALFSVVLGFSQNLPEDYLSAEFHKERREKVRELMSPNSVLVFFANAERNRANDVDYIYHQDPNFYYLTGYKEPNAVLLIFSDMQKEVDGQEYNEMIYVQERNAREEQWTGKRLGVEGVRKQLGFDKVFNGSDFADVPIDFKSFDTVSFFDFENDYRDKRGDADLFDLIKAFKIKANYPSDYDPIKQNLYAMIQSATPDNTENLVKTVERYLSFYENLNDDEFLTVFVNATDESKRLEVKERVNLVLASNNLDSRMISEIMATLRETKTPEELKLLKKGRRDFCSRANGSDESDAPKYVRNRNPRCP
ncbi:aminopeptidase P N-terminal domain-containing protein [Maribacter sp. 4G9]|uniref:aminopeptidase P N-terminal domain-containing protein n=1 Tax=Maribacter sp. 4G9 TaxID=1889777 RepID=UPI0026AB8264|nr:aminopeptidase P N-terminal domain-containing protein [Maribacter sp. 4G9]